MYLHLCGSDWTASGAGVNRRSPAEALSFLISLGGQLLKRPLIPLKAVVHKLL